MTFFYDHQESLGYLSGLTSRLCSNLLVRRFQDAGIDMTAEQWGAILILLDGEAMTQSQLGARLCLEKSSVSRLVDGLERRGWITRAKASGDGRFKLVTPTTKALDEAQRCAPIAWAALEEAQRGLTEEERGACRSFLRRIIANLE